MPSSKPGLLARIKRWFVTLPPPDALLFTNVRAAARVLHSHEWEYRCDPDEEEHGKNPTKRYCKTCGRVQHAFYHPFGNIRITWSDVVPSIRDSNPK